MEEIYETINEIELLHIDKDFKKVTKANSWWRVNIVSIEGSVSIENEYSKSTFQLIPFILSVYYVILLNNIIVAFWQIFVFFVCSIFVYLCLLMCLCLLMHNVAQITV